MNFLGYNDILYHHWYGFRPKHSNIHSMLHILNHCAEANHTASSHLTLATFCDLSKAFDTISHTILLHKFNPFGIRRVANKWIERNLTNRSQFVDIDSHISPNLPIRCWVRPRFHPWPTRFLMCINDISDITTKQMVCPLQLIPQFFDLIPIRQIYLIKQINLWIQSLTDSVRINYL